MPQTQKVPCAVPLLLSAALLLCVALFLCSRGTSVPSTPAFSQQPAAVCPVPPNSAVVRFLGSRQEVVAEQVYSTSSNVFSVSGYIKNAAAWSVHGAAAVLEITWDPGVFDMTARLLDGCLLGTVDADDAVEVLHLMEYLAIEEHCEAEHYAALARGTVGHCRAPAGDARTEGTWEAFREKILEGCRHVQSFRTYVLHLLRVCAGDHGMCVSVCGEKKTLRLGRCSGDHGAHTGTGRAGAPGVWKLSVEMNSAYKSHADVQRMAEMLVEAMDIDTVDIGVAWWCPEDNAMIVHMIQKTQQARVSVVSARLEPGAVSVHMRELESHLVGLDVSQSKVLDDADWATVGGMARLERLCIKLCAVPPGTISRHFQGLRNSLVELDVTWNRGLDEDDWMTVGEMPRLAKLSIKSCNTEPGTIFRHFQGLRNSLVELDVSENMRLNASDWKTIGEMSKLAKLDMGSCHVQPGTIFRHFQGLRNSLVELDVPFNQGLDDLDWKTVGGMARLVRLNIRNCDAQPGTISRHFQGLKNSLVELDVVFFNQGLDDTDWKTVGGMTGLVRLNIGSCYAQPGTISRHFQRLRNSLVELDVSQNRALDDSDWKTVGEMLRLRKLDIRYCDMQPGTISRHFQGLKSRLAELNVVFNQGLDDSDWNTVGEMARLKRLDMAGCNVQPGAIFRHFQGLKSHMVRLSVSWNRELSEDDWKTVGEMQRLERLYIAYCGIQPGAISRHLQGLRNHIVKLNVSSNKELNDSDWKTLGEMARLEKLNVGHCNIQAGTVSRHFHGLRSRLVWLCVNGNEQLNDDDWKTVGEMAALEMLSIGYCGMQQGTFSRYLEGLRCCIVGYT